jgi:hypothetical protein
MNTNSTGPAMHSTARLESGFRKIHEKFRKKQPLFREAAIFREEACSAWSKGAPVPSWFSELLADPWHEAAREFSGGRLDVHSILMLWVGMKLRSVSDTSNWFRPTDALTYKLLATDLRGAVAGDLHLPMDAFYIEMPAGVFYLEDRRTGWHEVRTLVVTQGEITKATIDLARVTGDPTADYAGIGKRLLVECYAEPNTNSTGPFDDAWIFMSYAMGEPEAPIESVIAPGLTQMNNMGSLNRGRCGERIMDGAELREFLLKFVLNLCVYLGSAKARVEHVHEEEIKRLRGDKKWKKLRKSTQERIQRLESDRVFVVGSDVTIDAEIREHVRRGTGSGVTQAYRTLVRGHWKNQPHGPALALRKRTWIEPHVRGAELPTKTVGHNYVVR